MSNTAQRLFFLVFILGGLLTAPLILSFSGDLPTAFLNSSLSEPASVPEGQDAGPPVEAVSPAEAQAGFLPTTGNVQVSVYDTLELVFAAAQTPKNPFNTYLLRLEVTDPSGRSFQMDGFYDGDGRGGQEGKVWKARLAPYAPGVWRWRTIPGDAADEKLDGLSGEFTVVAGDATGGVVADGRYFRFQNGEPVFLGGNFLDFTNGLRSTHTFMSETTKDNQRQAILDRQRDFHAANKINLYFANKGDYDNQSVTPWLGNASNPDRSRMDLGRWKNYDTYLQQIKDNHMLAEMWFFADDSNFGGLPAEAKNRLARYAMARTSGYSHTLYVLALEWQEGWSEDSVRNFGKFVQAHNPWARPVSVHGLTLSKWAFSGQDWADFIASQAGNDSHMDVVWRYTAGLFQSENLPHLGEEFGILRDDSNSQLRNRMWATLAGGAAGVGTGSDLKALQRFLAESRMPFQRMRPNDGLVSGGGSNRFALAEDGRHYLVYSAGGSFELRVSGQELKGYWFNPRNPDASLQGPFDVAPGQTTYTPPNNTDQDWVLWVTDGSNLNSGRTHIQGGKLHSVTVGTPSAPVFDPNKYTHFNFIPMTTR